jgi:hypothetical protein
MLALNETVGGRWVWLNVPFALLLCPCSLLFQSRELNFYDLFLLLNGLKKSMGVAEI